jgi:hypothetical protein
MNESVHWLEPAQITVNCVAYVNTMVNLQIPQKQGFWGGKLCVCNNVLEDQRI